MEIKDFRGVSIRGLTAYGICCLENALLYYNLQEDEGWQFLLEKYWLYTSLPETKIPSLEDGNSENMNNLDCLYIFYGDSEPANVVEEAEGKKLSNARRIKTFDKDKITLLYATYKKTNEIVLKIVDAIINVATTEMNGWSNYPTYMTLEELETLLIIMQSNNIALPEIERFKKYSLGFDVLKNISMKYESKAWGTSFDGKKELSKILK